MMVRVKLFALAKQLTGMNEIILEMERPATIGALRRELAKRGPEFAGLAQRSLFAVGTDYATDGREITETDDLAMIPPVSGG